MTRGIAASLAALFLQLFSFADAAGAPQVVAVVGGCVIDGTGKGAIDDAVVLIARERIAAVGPREDVVIPPGAQIIDARGKWIVPGLIDAHIHFFQSGGLYTRPDVIDLRDIRPYDEELAAIDARLPATFARYLASGVTGVVDVGGPFWNFAVRELAHETGPAPRVAVAGPLISTYLPQELATDDPPIIKVDSPRAARALVRRQLPYRPDLVKIWFIPLPGADLTEQTAIVRAAIEESHAAGLRAAVHATQLEVARAAVRAGADILVHSVDDRAVDAAFVQLLKERNVLYITTLVVNEGYEEVLGQDVRLTDIEKRVGDPRVIATFRDLKKLPAARVPFWARGTPHSPSRVALANLKRLHDGGVVIAAGTDAGNIGTLHGPALHREFELMAQAGLSPAQILRAATDGGARVMGRAHELGTLETGKLADMLIVDADPLADVAHLRRIVRVIKSGRVFSQAALLAAADESG